MSNRNLVKEFKNKGLWDKDQFPYKEWGPDNEQAKRTWKAAQEYFQKTRPQTEEAFNFRLNLIDQLIPFVNKRGIRKRPFIGDEHEVRLTQVDIVPGDAKLIYRNQELQVGAMVPVYLKSQETIKKDIESVAKPLWKKAKKVIRGRT